MPNDKFLQFLYAERDRVRNQESVVGWSYWALCGSIFALVYYIYSVIKVHDARLDLTLCYYIFSSFFPLSLYIIFISERNNGYRYGDRVHIARVKDSTSKLSLSFMTLISSCMISGGIFLQISSEIVLLWGVILIIVFVSWVILLYYRNRYVTTFDNFVLSNKKWLNRLMLCSLSGVILLPMSSAAIRLTWGFCAEFECCIALIMILTMMFIIIRNRYVYNYGEQLDALIDCYLYHNWTSDDVIIRLENIFLGIQPAQEIIKSYGTLQEIISKIPDVEEQVSVVLKSTESVVCPLQYKKYIEDLKHATDFIDQFINLYISFSSNSKEILSLETTVLDDEFRSMIESFLTDESIRQAEKKIDQIQKNISSISHKYLELIDNCSNTVH